MSSSFEPSQEGRHGYTHATNDHYSIRAAVTAIQSVNNIIPLCAWALRLPWNVADSARSNNAHIAASERGFNWLD